MLETIELLVNELLVVYKLLEKKTPKPFKLCANKYLIEFIVLHMSSWNNLTWTFAHVLLWPNQVFLDIRKISLMEETT